MQGHEKLYGSMTPLPKRQRELGVDEWGIVGAQSGALGGGIGKWWGLRTVSQAHSQASPNKEYYWVLSPESWLTTLSLSLFIGNEKNGQRSKPAHVNVTHSQSLKTLTPVHRHTTRFAHLRSSGTVCVRSACHVPLSHSVSARVGNCTSLESLSVKIF